MLSTPLHARARGMTLIEMTVVIFGLMGLISVTFIAAKAWKRGADRSLCVLNIQVCQKSIRSFANLYGYHPGDKVGGLRSKMYSENGFIRISPVCKGGGTYSFGAGSDEDTIPEIGKIYLECSLGDTRDHSLPPNSEW
jgi:type II secretory pathway pseudopilin PulG